MKLNQKTFIFNIQRYSLHDGPGIRTIIFFKGCPLRCRWCCNPESQLYEPEISYTEDKCIGRKECGSCQKFLGSAVSFKSGTEKPFSDKAALNFAQCRHNLQCAASCPARAIKTEGRLCSAMQLLDTAERDSVFYGHGSGGLTVSGGEPLTHPDFLLEVLREARKRHITTAVETCGYADYDALRKAANYLDTVLFDIKSLDSAKHKQYTERGNELILSNFERLCRDYPHLSKIVRTPVIPNFNDEAEDLSAILQFVLSMPHQSSISYEALPYHRFGAGKYKALGRPYLMGDTKLTAAKTAMTKKLNELAYAEGAAAALRYLKSLT